MDDSQGVTSSSGEESSMEDESIHIELTAELREILEKDYYLVKEQNKVYTNFSWSIDKYIS